MNITNIKQELLTFLRNQDIMTTSQRGVTTDEATGTLSGEDTITISKTNVKNIRSITVDAVTKYLGQDYSVDYGTGVSGSVCTITFGSNQTGDYSVSYDYGTDSIFDDMPRDDLSVSSYPRIAVLLTNGPGLPFGVGGDTFISDLVFQVIVYADNHVTIDSYIDSIVSAFQSNAKNFYYLKFIYPQMLGPLISSPDRKNEIMQRNQDFLSKFNVDTV